LYFLDYISVDISQLGNVFIRPGDIVADSKELVAAHNQAVAEAVQSARKSRDQALSEIAQSPVSATVAALEGQLADLETQIADQQQQFDKVSGAWRKAVVTGGGQGDNLAKLHLEGRIAETQMEHLQEEKDRVQAELAEARSHLDEIRAKALESNRQKQIEDSEVRRQAVLLRLAEQIVQAGLDLDREDQLLGTVSRGEFTAHLPERARAEAILNAGAHHLGPPL
jgi:hypothetical protein